MRLVASLLLACATTVSLPTITVSAAVTGYSFMHGTKWMHESDKVAGEFKCKASTVRGYCIVPSDKAEQLCLAIPGCVSRYAHGMTVLVLCCYYMAAAGML